MRRGTLGILVIAILGIIFLSQILITSKLDISTITHFGGGTNYVDSIPPSPVVGEQTTPQRRKSLRTSSSSFNPSTQSPNENPFSEKDFLNACGITTVNSDVLLKVKQENSFTSGNTLPIRKSTKNQYPPPLTSSGKRQVGGHATAIVVVSYERPQYLVKMMNRMYDVLRKSPYAIPVYISLGSEDAVTATMAASAQSKFSQDIPDCPVKILRFKHNMKDGDTAYSHMAKHFAFAIKTAFGASNAEQLIVIEDDMLIADDFFDYFSALSFLLYEDPSIYTISAYNDNGKEHLVFDNTLALRSDFFTAGAWMIKYTEWNRIHSSWPDSYWLEWMRESSIFADRVCIRPEVSRVVTFGESGLNPHPNRFYLQDQLRVVLNSQAADFSAIDYSYLLKDNYDMLLNSKIQKAYSLFTLEDIIKTPVNSDVKIIYDELPGPRNFRSFADQIGLMGDLVGKTFRTAYKGVVVTGYNGYRLFLVPRSWSSSSIV